MKKIIILSIFFIISIISYSDVKWSGDSGKMSIIYKVVDPLIVKVDQPERIIVSQNQKTFTYSKMSSSKKVLAVNVTSSYNYVDEILREIYKTVYFELVNNGDFVLKQANTIEEIKGKGYFIDSENNATYTNKLTKIDKPFSSSVAGNIFSATTGIDADFTLPEGDVPMGVYTGTLKLNVWFGGTL